jgi:transglutaminase-like putative cysteine protease
VSSGAQVAVLASGRGARAQAVGAGAAHRRGTLPLATFAALGIYGTVRWATMFSAPPIFRLLGLVGLAVAIAALGDLARSRSRPLQAAAVAAIYLCCLAVFPLSGFPLHWALHMEIGQTLSAVSAGTSRLPQVIVPYGFAHSWTRAVIVLGAGLLLLAGGLTLAVMRRGSGEMRLACAALPLMVLAIVPSTLTAPRFPYLHGALLFVLLAAFLFSERVAAGRGPLTYGAVALAAIGGLIVAPALDQHSPWLSVSSLAGTNGPPRLGESFNWNQTYGPLVWPHRGSIVLDVRAPQRFYWKAEDLDMFDGRVWAQSPVGSGPETAQASIAPRNLERWVQTLTVSLRGMSSTAVIAAGYVIQEPIVAGGQHAPLPAAKTGQVPGTWITTAPLQPGAAYEVRAYTPAPSPGELSRAGVNYPMPDLREELRMQLPRSGASRFAVHHHPELTIEFAPYGSRSALEAFGGTSSSQAVGLLARSPYGPVYALAQRLKRGTNTPYAFVEAVKHYLASGFNYNILPPVYSYPIVAFLTGGRLGYCQQFAGAMALLLRMGGVPARVAVGFTPGLRVPRTNTYFVSDRDAHAWVEAWFPAYGWVEFDPTPRTPSLDRLPAGAALAGAAGNPRSALAQRARGHRRTPGGAATAGRRRGNGSDVLGPALAIGAALTLAAAAWLAWLVGRAAALRGADARLAELERAFALCGRPLVGGLTLEALERLMRPDADAEAYVRAIRLARFARVAPEVRAAGRRAVRRQLSAGLGPMAALRALLALPPYPRWFDARRRAPR